MKKVLLTLTALLLFPLSSLDAQIKIKQKVVEPPQEKKVQHYDSLVNVLPEKDFEQYIGQTFYLPHNSYDDERGYKGFRRNLADKIYKTDSFHKTTKPKYVAGKYFKVIDICRENKGYIDDIYIKLKNLDNDDILYFAYGVPSNNKLPFIVVGYYEKLRTILIGKTFYKGTYNCVYYKKCIDFYLEEDSYSPDLVMKFDDGSEDCYNNSFISDQADLKRYRELMDKSSDESKKKAELENKYGPFRIGMSADDCQMLLGYPQDINTTVTEHGTSEQWVYPDKYVYIEDGKVVSYQEQTSY